MKQLFLIMLVGLTGQVFAGRLVLLKSVSYQFQQPLEQDTALKALRYALASKGWELTKEEGNTLFATVAQGQHVVYVRIVFDAEGFQVFHQMSRHMKYRRKANGREYIHEGYYRWLNKMSQQVNKAQTLME